MKKTLKSIVVIILAALSFTVTSCENYPEGVPSVYSSEYRVINLWQVSHSYINGDTVSKDDPYIAFVTGSYYYIYADNVLTVLGLYNGELRQSTFATWILNPKAKTLELDFNLVSKKYRITADIMKLSRKELIIEFDDENGDHRRLEMFARVN